MTEKEDKSNGVSSGYAINQQDDGTYTVSRVPTGGDKGLESAMDVGNMKRGKMKRLDSEPTTGGALTDVSQKQAGEGKGASFVNAPTTQTSSTSIKNETNNVQSGPLQSISSDIFSVFSGRRYN